ncbi:18754_t:CDS:1 [Acaulospora morrowiae]|uniref:18754_t:CDS:1 n=1 Tax=Acaulospora morrowiae TaxID=94023 RepID=A0A9N9CIC8_9GLOM|nr:18754_t:CDS:1 [Acaulospora morrowiae]
MSLGSSFSLADPGTPGFSYLLLFKEEYRTDASFHLKRSPLVWEVADFMEQNLFTISEDRIKPSRFDHNVQAFQVESGTPPTYPIRDWEDEDDFQERINQYNIERLRWFTVKSFIYSALHNYSDYKFM